jgi:hypothetical protein
MVFADNSLAGALRPAWYGRRLPCASAGLCRTVLFAVQLLEGRGVAASQPFLFRCAPWFAPAFVFRMEDLSYDS